MSKSAFSYTVSENDTPVITLTAGDLSIKIAPEKGSNMFDMTYKGHALIYCDKKILQKAGFTGTYVLFPTPNRVDNFTYMWNEKSYTLQKNGEVVDIHHQLAFDQKWRHYTPKIHADHVSVQTTITIDKHSHLFEGFPFPCSLTLTYRLYPSAVRIEYCVKNLGDDTLPFGFGLHPHFARLSGSTKTLIQIPANLVMENKEGTMIPTGKLFPVVGPTDIRISTPAGKLHLDHVFTDLLPSQKTEITHTSLGFKVQLSASSDFTHIVCWGGHPKAVCIENQTCSTDAHNLFSRGFKKESHLLTIEPGKSHSGFISYQIEQI